MKNTLYYLTVHTSSTSSLSFQSNELVVEAKPYENSFVNIHVDGKVHKIRLIDLEYALNKSQEIKDNF